MVSGEHLQKSIIFLTKFCTKILWYWSVPSCHLKQLQWTCKEILELLHFHFELFLALQVLPSSPISLCHGKISVCLTSPSSPLCPLEDAYCLWWIIPCLLYLSLVMFLSPFMFLHVKSWYFKTLWIYKTCCYARRWVLQILTHIWCNDEDLIDGHCWFIRVPGALYPLVFHLLFHTSQRVLMIEAWEHNSQVLDQDSKHKVNL